MDKRCWQFGRITEFVVLLSGQIARNDCCHALDHFFTRPPMVNRGRNELQGRGGGVGGGCGDGVGRGGDRRRRRRRLQNHGVALTVQNSKSIPTINKVRRANFFRHMITELKIKERVQSLGSQTKSKGYSRQQQTSPRCITILMIQKRMTYFQLKLQSFV